MMIDFAIEAERREGTTRVSNPGGSDSAVPSHHDATMAALVGTFPSHWDTAGAESSSPRRGRGGGLLFSNSSRSISPVSTPTSTPAEALARSRSERRGNTPSRHGYARAAEAAGCAMDARAISAPAPTAPDRGKPAAREVTQELGKDRRAAGYDRAAAHRPPRRWHVLLEGYPAAKTLAVRTLAATIAGGFHRIRSLRPAAVLTEHHDLQSAEWRLTCRRTDLHQHPAGRRDQPDRQGAERAVEAMQEKQVTISADFPCRALPGARHPESDRARARILARSPVRPVHVQAGRHLPGAAGGREVLDRIRWTRAPARHVLDPERVLRARQRFGVYVEVGSRNRPRSGCRHAQAGSCRPARSRPLIDTAPPQGSIYSSVPQGPAFLQAARTSSPKTSRRWASTFCATGFS